MASSIFASPRRLGFEPSILKVWLSRLFKACQIFVAAYGLIFVLAALVPHVSVAAGCNIESYTGANGPFHIYVTGSCSTSQAASDACLDFAHSHNYNYALCNHANYTPTWNAGWLCGSGNGGGYCLPPDINSYLGNFYYFRYYVSTEDVPLANCDGCNGVGDPINPANGAAYKSFKEMDLETGSSFSKFYNSLSSGSLSIGRAWRHSYQKSIAPHYHSASYQPYTTGNPKYSPYYATPSQACSSGFVAIRSRVTNWQSTISWYSNGVCLLLSNGVITGALRLKAFLVMPGSEGYLGEPGQRAISMGPPAESESPVLFDAIRDDGQIVRFYTVNGVVISPSGSNMRLQRVSGGYALTDGNDNVEQYDTSGKLLSITSRAGFVQSMSYDGSGRLSGVSDAFGHQLVLGYDAQNRLISVTKQ